ncbi:PucR family transcriptional regulator [Agrococcus sp. Marseille-P2731]|uniref:PucR family transcriptional regulator n=1 Tax=Agrococcus sp. Marseille-P2731 TaxID=1841862 RepID=UPI0009317A43|nr:helix-turn-helix domain-containing protein [Agrococcus sp. Marseille-P2731]
MAADLQQLVQSLALRLDRSVAIDDARLRLLAHSSHRGDVDPIRAESILRRAVPPGVVEHVHACRDDATGRYLVTPREDLGLLDPRVGQPILQQETLLGFVWLLASEGPIDEAQLAALEGAAAEASVLIHGEFLRATASRDRERELVERLLGADSGERAAAAVALRAEGLFAGSPYAVLHVEIDRGGEPTAEEDPIALAAAIAAARSRRASHDVLSMEHRDHAVLLVAEAQPDAAEEAFLALGEALRTDVLRATEAERCWVGIARVRTDLAQAAEAAHEARRAARICRRVDAVGPIASIDGTGVYALLDHVPDDALRAIANPRLLALIADERRGDPLVRTLEVFLDTAGDVRAASELLFAHRTSLYYRLRRIQELTGLDLASGDDRLRAHLTLKIADLLGIGARD